MSLRDRIGPEGMRAAEHRYAVTRATEVINRRILPVAEGDPRIGDGRDIAQALDAAGLLASPEHDTTVAAKALRDAAHEIFLGYWITAPVVRWLHERADRIEREGGAS